METDAGHVAGEAGVESTMVGDFSRSRRFAGAEDAHRQDAIHRRAAPRGCAIRRNPTRHHRGRIRHSGLSIRHSLHDTRVFEVDHPSPQSAKVKRINEAFGEAPTSLSFVGVDLQFDDLGYALLPVHVPFDMLPTEQLL